MERDQDLWLTKRELAQALNLSVKAVERLSLPHRIIDEHKRYKLEEVEAELAWRRAQRARQDSSL